MSVLFILNLKQFSTNAASSTGVSVTVTWDNNAASTNFVMSKTVTSNRNYFAFALLDDQLMVNINVIFESTLLFYKNPFYFFCTLAFFSFFFSKLTCHFPAISVCWVDSIKLWIVTVKPLFYSVCNFVIQPCGMVRNNLK